MIEAVKGTRDILPGEVERWQLVEARAREIFARFGFREIRTPIFESTELFRRGVGETTDIVAKEMYTFEDRKGRSLTLRPEGTAPVARALIEAGRFRGGEQHRLYYIGPMFRYERPQKGRTRQFAQIGVEALGSENPAVDAETLQMLMQFLASLGLGELALQINSVGDDVCRPVYREVLLKALRPHRERLCIDCQRRLETNPLRCLDCKVESDRAIMAGVPTLVEYLCKGCSDHFMRVGELLNRLGVAYAIDPRLVRGLDYYRRTTFEVVSSALGAQSALLGGGRYDGLVQELGGPPVPGFGFAVGEDRLVMLLAEDAPGIRTSLDAYVIALGEAAIAAGLEAAGRLRAAGRCVLLEPQPEKSLKAQLRRANDLGARHVVILGADEAARGSVTLKSMADGTQREVPAANLVEALGEPAHV
ncbi:MAG TPA: histidine--tRNA ligase [Candidatus Polarisedimenticolia bacterium]|nr:histidine--tRNA ligase [Candidatus Polarisedimenticolia bacterium]